MPEHHVTCQEIVELVTDYLEHALDSETAAAVRGAHQLLRRLRGLPRCRCVRRSRPSAAIEDEDVPAETRERLLSAFREWKQA